MSTPACAEGYDTPAQQREDSTTFMVVICDRVRDHELENLKGRRGTGRPLRMSFDHHG